MPTKCACGCDLIGVRSQTLDDEHPFVEAQRVVSEIIAGEVATFGIFATVHTSAREALTQIRSIANRVLNYASIHGLEAVQPWELTDGFGAKMADTQTNSSGRVTPVQIDGFGNLGSPPPPPEHRTGVRSLGGGSSGSHPCGSELQWCDTRAVPEEAGECGGFGEAFP